MCRAALLSLCLGLGLSLAPAGQAQAEKVGVAAAVNPDAFSSLSQTPNKQLNIGKSIFYDERINTSAPVLALAATLAAFPAAAEPTEITVRVLGKDSKFVGSSMGGARVTLRDAHTGEILSQGVTESATGDTARIMGPRENSRAVLSTDDAAKFTATIDIDAPRLIEVEAYGPLGQPQAAHSVRATQWVVPGRDITGGDGWVLELPGYVVDVLAPPAHVKLGPDTGKVEVTANVVLMCGCPIQPGGLWDADTLEVTALITRDGEQLDPVRLAYAGETSQFEGAVPAGAPGVYDVTVYAYNAANGNTGLDRTTFIVAE